MIQPAATDGKNLELVDLEHDIAQVLTKSLPQRDHRATVFAPPKVRPLAQPIPPYVEHHANIDQIGKLSAEAMIAQYEAAVKALEEMGATLIDCVKRAEGMAAGCKDTFAFVRDTARQYREEAKLIFDRIEQASVMTAEVKSVCDEIRKKMDNPTQSA